MMCLSKDEGLISDSLPLKKSCGVGGMTSQASYIPSREGKRALTRLQ